MNLNLLPDKYVKNRAPMLLVTSYVIFVGIAFVLIIFFFGLLTISVNKQRNLVSLRKVEQIKLTKNIKGLKNANSIEVQDAIKELKEKQILMNKVVKVFGETFNKKEAVLWSYELKLLSGSEGDTAKKTFDNKALISVDLSGAAVYYGKDGAQKVVAELEAIPWIYSAMIVTTSLHEEGDDLVDAWASKENVHDLTIKVQLIKDELPSIARNNK